MAKKQQSRSESIVRSPIVTVMGHVDHGKTSLLDYIRKSRVVAKEAGGITQHIGAYQVEVTHDKKDKKQKALITFIDTPGHAAFEQMRSRGGQAADLVVLVISATEGVKPQTKESLDHIKKAGVPFLVAYTKMDMETANVDTVKNDLSELGYITEDWGGDVIGVPVSVVTGEGIDKLLESILLVAEMQELRAETGADMEALVIESELDSRRGIVANAIVMNGTLRVRDEIATQTVKGRVRALFNDHGKGVQEAGPSMPVQILGFEKMPSVGEPIQLADKIEVHQKESSGLNVGTEGVVSVILKADVAGSLEALEYILPEGVRVLDKGVGDVTLSDIELAAATDSMVIVFNISPKQQTINTADTEGVILKSFKVIYELADFLDEAVRRSSDPYFDANVLGRAECLALFSVNKDRIIGGKVTEGTIVEKALLDVWRNGKLVNSSRISNLRQGKDEVERVTQNHEFGMLLSTHVNVRKGDELVAYTK